MANPIYLIGVAHPVQAVRVFAMGLVFQFCILRCLGLFIRELCALSAAALLLYCRFGISPLVLLGVILLVTQLWCWLQAARRAEYNAGHRAGAKGFTGLYVENTIEAMQALVRDDNDPRVGPVPHLHYVEVDVQETKDGELVILHDFHIGDAFPNTGPNLEPFQQLQQQLGLSQQEVAQLHVKDLTLRQLHSLQLGGRHGLRAPRLSAFMQAFRAASCRRPLVIEIKCLQSDAAREKLVQLLREHQPYAQHRHFWDWSYTHPQLKHLALISFPHYYAASMGEMGGKRWRHWAQQLVDVGVPVRCCFLETISYCRGIASTS